MAGCTNGDRVDEVRVGQVQIVGHGVVLNRAISEVLVFYGVSQENFRLAKIVSDVVVFVYICACGCGSLVTGCCLTMQCVLARLTCFGLMWALPSLSGLYLPRRGPDH